MKFPKGFTLIELLTVIAIIAILSAIIFPVFARAKDQAYRSADMSSMNALRTALQLYKADQNAYPPRLLGYATGYSDAVPSAADIVPADKVVGALYPKRVDGIQNFRPSPLRAESGVLEKEFMTAVWPNSVSTSNGAAASSLQRYTINTVVNRAVLRDELLRYDPTTADSCRPMPAYFYRMSGYDAATVPGRNELRYTLFWTGWTVPNDPCNPTQNEQGDGQDDPRQLGYSDPPDSTVVTWNSFYRDYVNGVPERGRREIVLFLGGSARPYDSLAVHNNAYQVKP
jgi:prepilin-type N-terminal cleavage/methylation domain-containing protein